MALAAKEAISAARAHFAELFPDRSGLRLEEIERYGPNWAITFSMNSTGFSVSPFGMGREAKTIIISGEDGSFISLKQRAA